MKVRIKKLHNNAVMPTYAKLGDAGCDLVAVSKNVDEWGNIEYGIGLAFEIPEGYVGLVFPRSSNCKKDLYLTNSVAVIDSGYRGEVRMKYRPTDNLDAREYEVGERVAQIIIMPYPHIEFEFSSELSDSERGTTGFGSSGK